MSKSPQKKNWKGKGRGKGGYFNGRPFIFEKKKLDPCKFINLCLSIIIYVYNILDSDC